MENGESMEIRRIELQQYKTAVENLASSKSNLIFNNSSPEHAAIVLSAMLKYSNSEFRIYDNDLSGDISELNPDFFDNLSAFISAGKSVKIVIDSLEQSANSQAYKSIIKYKEMYPNTVKLAIANDSFKDSVSKMFEKKINFALGDKTSFRIEDSIGDLQQRKAYCCFNNPNITQKLADVFDSSFISCKAL
jgi:hypothetical protein